MEQKWKHIHATLNVLAHAFPRCAPGMSSGAHTSMEHAHNCFPEKQTICMSQSSEAQIMHTYTLRVLRRKSGEQTTRRAQRARGTT